MAANNTLTVTQLDYQGVNDSLVSFLKNYPQFKDYDFEGSNLRTLIDLLSYNTYLNSFYTNMAINEMFLDTAAIRDSVISHAKELNYLPRSYRSSEAKIDLIVYPNDNPPYIKVTKGTSFSGTDGQRVFGFITDQDLLIFPVNGIYSATNISVFEGISVSEVFTVDTSLDNQRFILSNPNIDTTSLVVEITNSNGLSDIWSYSTSLLGLTSTSKSYFIQATSDKYELIFGDDIVAAAPPNNATITATYRICNGDAPNGIKKFKLNTSIGSYTSATVTASVSNGSIISATGGAKAESTQSIRLNAPRSFQTLERAVTADDYKNILYSQFPEIRALHVYGGDELDPPQYGKVYIVADVTNAEGLSDLEAAKLTSYINTRAPMSIHSVVVPANYTYASIVSNVTYDLNSSARAPSDIQSSILNSLVTYNSTYLDNFNVTLRYSKVASAIDNTDSSITSSETNISILKKVVPELNTNYSVSLDYQNALTPKSIKSSTFTYNGIQAKFIDNGKGLLQIATTSSSTRSIINIGTIDYTNGIINITNFNISAYQGLAINLFATTTTHDFSCRKDTILLLDTSNITINVTGIRA